MRPHTSSLYLFLALRFDVILEMAKKGGGRVDEGERESPDHHAHKRTRRCSPNTSFAWERAKRHMGRPEDGERGRGSWRSE